MKKTSLNDIAKRLGVSKSLVSLVLNGKARVLATVFVVDQFMGPETGKTIFPFLHYKYTLNFGFRGLWAEILITGILFLVSAFTEKTAPEKLEKTTINYANRLEKFSGITDWRLHLAVLSAITVFLFIWLS